MFLARQGPASWLLREVARNDQMREHREETGLHAFAAVDCSRILDTTVARPFPSEVLNGKYWMRYRKIGYRSYLALR